MPRALFPTLLFALPALAGPVKYDVDPRKSELLALTTPVGLFKSAAHPHVIKAQLMTGKLVFDADDVSGSSVSVSVPVGSLEVDDPRTRGREGLTSMLSDDDRKKVAASMLAEDQLDPKHFPNISFTSTKVAKTGERAADLTGVMDLHGVKKTITVPITWAIDDDGTFRGEGKVVFNHKDFGMVPYSTALGTVRNDEPITLKLKLVATPQKPAREE